MIFLLALASVVLKAGRMAGLTVAIVVSFIFEVYLFEPYGSLAIRSAVDQIELSCFAAAAIGVVHFAPSSALFESRTGISKASERLENWFAIVGYAVIYTAIITLLLFLWDSMRYKE